MLKSYKIFSGPISMAGRFVIGTAFTVLQSASLAPAVEFDIFGPPPAGDPSAFTGPLIGLSFAGELLATFPPPNKGAFVGGPTGTHIDPGIDNVLPRILQTSANVPTNGKPSPLFGTRPFTQTLLLFEDFGRETLDPAAPAPAKPFPVPTVGPAPEQDPGSVAMSGPANAALEAFLAQPGIAPYPTQYSNTMDLNPWKFWASAARRKPATALLSSIPKRAPAKSPAIALARSAT